MFFTLKITAVMLIAFTVLSVATLGALSQAAADTLPEITHLKIQKLVAQRDSANAQLETLVVTFMNTNEQAKKLQEQAKTVDTELRSVYEEAFKAAGKSVTEYELNIETGKFMKREKK